MVQTVGVKATRKNASVRRHGGWIHATHNQQLLGQVDLSASRNLETGMIGVAANQCQQHLQHIRWSEIHFVKQQCLLAIRRLANKQLGDGTILEGGVTIHNGVTTEQSVRCCAVGEVDALVRESVVEEVVLCGGCLSHTWIALENHGNVASISQCHGEEELDGCLGRQELVLHVQRIPHRIQNLLRQESLQGSGCFQHHFSHLCISRSVQEVTHALFLLVLHHLVLQIMSRRRVGLEIKQVVGNGDRRIDEAGTYSLCLAENGKGVLLFVLELVLDHFKG